MQKNRFPSQTHPCPHWILEREGNSEHRRTQETPRGHEEKIQQVGYKPREAAHRGMSAASSAVDAETKIRRLEGKEEVVPEGFSQMLYCWYAGGMDTEQDPNRTKLVQGQRGR